MDPRGVRRDDQCAPMKASRRRERHRRGPPPQSRPYSVPAAISSLLRSLLFRGAVKRLDTPRNGQRIGICRSRSSFKLVGAHPRSGRTPDRLRQGVSRARCGCAASWAQPFGVGAADDRAERSLASRARARPSRCVDASREHADAEPEPQRTVTAGELAVRSQRASLPAKRTAVRSSRQGGPR
jgi:hypothetical protein